VKRANFGLLQNEKPCRLRGELLSSENGSSSHLLSKAGASLKNEVSHNSYNSTISLRGKTGQFDCNA
jgi:hypothetical protein